MTLRYGVIGSGVVAPLHLQAIAALDDAELVGISSLDGESLAARAAEFGVPAFADHRRLLAVEPDVVVICTPHPSHPALAIEALEHTAHVLVEKPLAVETREADAMIAAAERTGRLLGVCLQQRFRPVIAAARALVAGGAIGGLLRVSVVDPWYRPWSYFASADWRGTWQGEGGGVLMNQAPHTLDLLCHLTGRPSAVIGRSQRRVQPMEAEDTATALLEYDEGAIGTLVVSTTEPGVQRIEIVGERGRIEVVGETIAFDRFEPSLPDHRATAPGMFDQPAVVREEVTLPPGRGDHLDVHEDFADAIRTGRAPRAAARDALWSLELANAIVLSTHTGARVPLPVDRDAYAALLADLRSGKVRTP
jgi:predicted dehydrogenase